MDRGFTVYFRTAASTDMLKAVAVNLLSNAVYFLTAAGTDMLKAVAVSLLSNAVY
jgi:hypothetical protein